MAIRLNTPGESLVASYNIEMIEKQLGYRIPPGVFDVSEYCDHPLTARELGTICQNIEMMTRSSRRERRNDSYELERTLRRLEAESYMRQTYHQPREYRSEPSKRSEEVVYKDSNISLLSIFIYIICMIIVIASMGIILGLLYAILVVISSIHISKSPKYQSDKYTSKQLLSYSLVILSVYSCVLSIIL